MDTLTTKELDDIYQRAEKTIDVTDQAQLEEFIGTHRIFNGKNKDGTTRFKLMRMPLRGNQDKLVQSLYEPTRLKEEIEEAERIGTIERLRKEVDVIKLPESEAERIRTLVKSKRFRIAGEESRAIRREFFGEIRESETAEEVNRIERNVEASEILDDEQKTSLMEFAEEMKKTIAERGT